MRHTALAALILSVLFSTTIIGLPAEASVIAPAQLHNAATDAQLSQNMIVSCSYHRCGHGWQPHPYYSYGYGYGPYDVPYYGYYRPWGWSDLNRSWWHWPW
jgi:hypothetical protein